MPLKPAPPLGTRDTAEVPFRVTDDNFIPAERYTSQAFHDLEMAHIWRRQWQVAAREQDIPRPGSFVEYRIGRENVLIVRTKAGEVRAFHNACMHRAAQLGQGCGSYPTGEIVCPFHGWTYDLEGNCTSIYAKQGFRPDMVEPAQVSLRPVRAATKWGMVWINFDPDAPELEAALGGVTDNIDPLWMDRMRVRWWKQIRLEANWKVAQEAFFESYHVQQSHPELSLFAPPDDQQMDMQDMMGTRILHTGGHWAQTHLNSLGKDAEALGLPPPPPEALAEMAGKIRTGIEKLIAYNRTMWVGAQAGVSREVYELTEAMVAAGVPLDTNFPIVLTEKLMADHAARGVPYPTPDPHATSWAHVFPNITFLYGYGCVLMYRARPAGDDPNACLFDFWSLEMVPDGTPVTRPEQADDAFFERMWLIQQDKGNIERQQVGLNTSGFHNTRLALRYEETISFFHRHLDQLLAEALATG